MPQVYRIANNISYAFDEVMTIMSRRLRIAGRKFWKGCERAGMQRAANELARLGYTAEAVDIIKQASK